MTMKRLDPSELYGDSGADPQIPFEPPAPRAAPPPAPRPSLTDSRRKVGPIRTRLTSASEVSILSVPWAPVATVVVDPGAVPFGSKVTVRLYASLGSSRVRIDEATSVNGEPVMVQGCAGCDEYTVTAQLETALLSNLVDSWVTACSFEGDALQGQGRKPVSYWSDPAAAAYETKRLLKSGPGVVWSLMGHSGGATSKFLMVFDAIVEPIAGTQPAMTPIPVDAGGAFSITFDRPRSFVTGLYFAGSSTGALYTPDAAAPFYLSAELG